MTENSDREHGLRVLILTADVGGGHDAAAHTLAAELHSEMSEAEVVVCNGLSAFGWVLRLIIRDGYRRQLRRCPWVYGSLYGLCRLVSPLRAFLRWCLCVLVASSLLDLVRSCEPDIVVSTYPGVTAVLGYLRRRGRVTVPIYATLTDLAGLEFWVHKGVDLHLVMHERCVEPVERVAGRGSARVIRPLVAPAFFAPLSQDEARRRLGYPVTGRLVLVSGGAWAVGDIEGSVTIVLSLPETTVVCVCGRDEQLHEKLTEAFTREPRVHVLGFTEQMNELLAACDALVHSMAGVTCLEALARCRPIIAYGSPPGHARVISAEMARSGLLETADSPAELVAALERAFQREATNGSELSTAPGAASAILGGGSRIRPLSTRRMWALRLAAVTALSLLLGGWTFSSDDPYPLVARTLHLHLVTAVTTPLPRVGLVICAPDAVLPLAVADLTRRGARASFAIALGPGQEMVSAVRRSGNEVLPELSPGSLTGWVHTRGRLRRDAAAYGLSHHFFYLPPREGFTLGQYILARHMGGLVVGGAMKLPAGEHSSWPAFHPGQIIVIYLESDPTVSLRLLDDALFHLARQGLSTVSLGMLGAAPSLSPGPRSLG